MLTIYFFSTYLSNKYLLRSVTMCLVIVFSLVVNTKLNNWSRELSQDLHDDVHMIKLALLWGPFTFWWYVVEGVKNSEGKCTACGRVIGLACLEQSDQVMTVVNTVCCILAQCSKNVMLIFITILRGRLCCIDKIIWDLVNVA
jgi:hypothetical protein